MAYISVVTCGTNVFILISAVMVGLMSPHHKENLRKNKDQLAALISPKTLVDHMYQSGVLSATQRKNILLKQTSQLRTSALLEQMEIMPDWTFHSLMDSIKATQSTDAYTSLSCGTLFSLFYIYLNESILTVII